MPAPTCYQHPDVNAAASCGGCLKPICSACAVFEGGKDRCPACVTRYWQAKRYRAWALSALGVVALVAGGAYVVSVSGSDGAPSDTSSFDYGPKAPLVAKLRGELKKEPCNRTQMMELSKLLFSVQDWRGTIQASEDFIARCGKFTQLRSLTYSAHIRLSEFDLALKDAAELIESAPRNAGYWVWSGLAHEALGDFDKAVADFQQAFGLQPDQLQVANQLASAYERQLKPCDALLVLLQHLQAKPSSEGDGQLQERMAALATAGQCDVGGKGRAVVSVSRNGAMWVEPLVNGNVRGRFLVDTGATSVAITQEFADKLGLDLRKARTVPIQTANGLTTARQTKVESIDLQGARATDVEVTVSSTLPEGMDGLLGLSFLARFEMRLDAQEGRLELTERKRPDGK